MSLLITFANILDPDQAWQNVSQAWQNVGPDLNPNFWYSDGIAKRIFQKSWIWKEMADDKKAWKITQ